MLPPTWAVHSRGGTAIYHIHVHAESLFMN